MEINGTPPATNLNSNLQSGNALPDAQSAGAAPSSQEMIENGQMLDPAAESALGSAFFSLLQNILSEAQNNAGS